MQLIYLFSLPIWNFVLPAYSYWNMDDFSWGETRKIQGEVKSAAGHGDKEGQFDSSQIVMKVRSLLSSFIFSPYRKADWRFFASFSAMGRVRARTTVERVGSRVDPHPRTCLHFFLLERNSEHFTLVLSVSDLFLPYSIIRCSVLLLKFTLFLSCVPPRYLCCDLRPYPFSPPFHTFLLSHSFRSRIAFRPSRPLTGSFHRQNSPHLSSLHLPLSRSPLFLFLSISLA